MSDDAAFEYLKAHELMFLGTASKTGNPHVSPMFYACEGNKIYFSAPPGSETDRWLKENPIAEIAVLCRIRDESPDQPVAVSNHDYHISFDLWQPCSPRCICSDQVERGGHQHVDD